MNKKTKKIVALGLTSLVTLGIGGVAGALLFPKEIVTTEYKTQVIDATEEQLKQAFNEGVASVEIPEPQVITEVQTVEVDNGNLQLVLEHIYDNDGNINYITQDLDDDEIDMIVDRIVLVNDFKELAIKSIKDDLFDELDGEIVDGIELDEKDMEKLKLNDDADEILIDDIDFEDKDATLIVTGTFRQDDHKFSFSAEVEFLDGEYDELGGITVELVE